MEDEVKEESIINTICKGLGRYYESVDVEYDNNFSTYCDDNGLDDESVLDELNIQDLNECLIIDFDDNFPIHEMGKDLNKNEFIYGLISKCYKNPNITFVIGEMESILCNKSIFDVTWYDLNESINIYKNQCGLIWKSGLNGDKTQLYLLTMGRKNNIKLSQYLIDSYLQERLSRIKKGYDESEWMKECIFYKRYKDLIIKIPINSNETTQITADELIKNSLQSFYKRCCPKLILFKPRIKINDSIEITIRYIHSAVGFISMLMNESKAIQKPICPFQMELCIAFDEAASFENDDDDDDDKKKEKEIEFIDCIGEIEGKLKENKLKYIKGCIYQIRENDFEYNTARDLLNIFNQFKEKYGLNKNDDEIYPHYKRFISFVDRRTNTNRDEAKENIWMYEAPSDSKIIPKNAVPEWYLNSSKMCLLPNIDYDGDKELLNSNISSSSHCNGQLLTLSFHCISIDEIKCYIYYNGQITRFMPDDIVTVLSSIFNMKWNNGKPLTQNQLFIEREKKELNRLIQEMKKVIYDKYFKTFQTWNHHDIQ